MEQVMKCGDLLTLKTLVERMKALQLSGGNFQGAKLPGMLTSQTMVGTTVDLGDETTCLEP